MDNSSSYDDHGYNSTSSLGTTWTVIRVEKVTPPLGLIICLGGLVGNGLILGLLGLSVKWGDFTVFIFHLSVADFLYLCCQTVSFMQILFTFHGISFDVRYVLALTNISYTVGLCVLIAISVWCCLSVLRPIWYRLHAPRHAPAVVSALIWVLSISVNVHLFLVCRVRKLKNRHSCDVYIIMWPEFSCVLFSVTLMCILIVLFKVRCGSQFHPPLRFYVTVLLTVLFLLFAFPSFIFVIFRFPIHQLPVLDLLLLLSCVNSSANPLVYYFVGRIGGTQAWGKLSRGFSEDSGGRVSPGKGQFHWGINSSG